MRKVFWDNPYQQTLVTKVAIEMPLNNPEENLSIQMIEQWGNIYELENGLL